MMLEIEGSLDESAEQLYCGPTCYAAKQRLGYARSSIISGFLLAGVPVPRLRALLRATDAQMQATIDQY
jgi:hypothetical protein